jgi:energy-coupling factor transporter ATP-binding protein EcfA2
MLKLRKNIINGVIKMIQVLTGEKGSGKTKKMISLANELAAESKGHVVYISNNSESMFELNQNIRLNDISQFPISSLESFVGFLYGIISEDYDIESIFIDNLNVILNEDNETICRFFEHASEISGKFNVRFITGVKGSSSKLPELEVEYIAV